VDELVERRPVKAVDLLVDVHWVRAYDATSRSGSQLLEAWRIRHTYFR
jgi:hypothetical protein